MGISVRTILKMLFLVLFTVSILEAQDFDCGTVVTEQQIMQEQQYHDLIFTGMQKRDDYVIDIPIAVHILRQSDGSGGLDPADLPDIFDSANVLLIPGNLHFFQYGPIDFIDSDYHYYNLDDQLVYNALRQMNQIPEAVNVYFVPGMDISGFGYCGISAFTSSSIQGILVSNNCVDVTNNKSTFTHEVGHYFDLYHTHETAFGIECPEGSNCTYAGDLLCDTPADPTLYENGIYHISEYPECAYDNSFPIPGGCALEPYDPDPTNLMSYSQKLCRDYFSPQQFAKFRSVAENLRTELLLGINGLFTNPREVKDQYALLGQSFIDSVQLIYIGDDIIEFTGATTTQGIINIIDPAGEVLNPFDSLFIKYSISSDYTSDSCNLSTLVDTLVLYTDNLILSEIAIPANISIVYNIPPAPESQFGSACLNFTAPNTPGFGNASDTAFRKYGWNGLYDGSLMIGLQEGTEKIVYMDCYTQTDFSVIDGFRSGTDSHGRQTRAVYFATGDNKIFGEVIYTFGKSTPAIDSCSYLLIEYVLRNPCDTNLLLYPGAYFDFDIEWSDWNNGVIDDTAEIIWVESDDNVNLVEAIVPLYSCNGPVHLRCTDNFTAVWPYSEFPDNLAFNELKATSNSPEYDHTDVGAMITFGATVLESGDQQSFKIAVMYSSSGSSYLYTLLDQINSLETGSIYDQDDDCLPIPLDNCPYDYNPDQFDTDGDGDGDACDMLCGDASGDYSVNVSDAVYIINFVFVGGNPPDPYESGDVNCDGSVNVSDAVYIINFVFQSGTSPCDPNGDEIPDC